MPPQQRRESGLTSKESNSDDAERIERRVTELDDMAFRSMATRREASVEAGRAFNELKQILGHGEWQRHFAETFAPHGISLRRAERYMKRAKEADKVSKIDTLSLFKLATDKGAHDVSEANEQAQAEVDAQLQHNRPKTKRLIYKIPLRMASDQMEAVDALRKSSHWPRAEKRIIRRLRDLCVKYGVRSDDFGGDS